MIPQKRDRKGRFAPETVHPHTPKETPQTPPPLAGDNTKRDTPTGEKHPRTISDSARIAKLEHLSRSDKPADRARAAADHTAPEKLLVDMARKEQNRAILSTLANNPSSTAKVLTELVYRAPDVAADALNHRNADRKVWNAAVWITASPYFTSKIEVAHKNLNERLKKERKEQKIKKRQREENPSTGGGWFTRIFR